MMLLQHKKKPMVKACLGFCPRRVEAIKVLFRLLFAVSAVVWRVLNASSESGAAEVEVEGCVS